MAHWDEIKNEYITGKLSYRKLAAKWGVSFRTLADRAMREGWTEARGQYQAGLMTRTAEIVLGLTGGNPDNPLEGLQRAASKMALIITRMVEDETQFNRKADARTIKELTGALKDLAYVMRNVYDLPTAQERQAMDIATERLNLEKKKADAVTVEDSETGVIELAPVLEVAGGE